MFGKYIIYSCYLIIIIVTMNRYNSRNKKAFTLIELVVVVSIITALSTIAFNSLQWYTLQARDSARLTDMWNMATSLNLFHVQSSQYPEPSWLVNINYSWSVVWMQWTFWKSVFENLGNLDRKPVDPLNSNEYTYSVTSNRNEFQLSWIMEANDLWMNNLVSQSNAESKIQAKAYNTWNYNWKILKSLRWTTCDLLAVPTIVTNDLTKTDLQKILNDWNLVYTWYKNLPSSFSGTDLKIDWWFNFEPNSLVVYSDTNACDELKNSSSKLARVNLLKDVQGSYTWTLIKNNSDIKDVLWLNTVNPNIEATNYINNFINNVLWESN